ncbi:MAG: hypothetical protein V3R29_07090, partial [Candidatus Acidoferrales bacterium]
TSRQFLIQELEEAVRDLPEVIDALRDQLFGESDDTRRERLRTEIDQLERLLPEKERKLELLRALEEESASQESGSKEQAGQAPSPSR